MLAEDEGGVEANIRALEEVKVDGGGSGFWMKCLDKGVTGKSSW